jgi:recombination protein RecT
MSLDRVKERIAPAAEPQAPTLYEQVESLAEEVARALPGTIDAERFVRNTLTVLRQTPKLAQCTWPSIAGALMTAAQVGLEPGPLGHCWLIPRWNRTVGANEATFQLGWTGILELARRSGRIGTVDGGWFFDGELIEERYGSSSELIIRPRRPRPTGEPVGYWVAVEMLDGARPMFKLMDRAEIVAHADRHAPKDRNGNLTGAWGSDFDTMAVISVFRSMRNWLPLSPEMSTALADDPAPVLSPAPSPTRTGEIPVLDGQGLPARASVVEGGPFPDGEPFGLDVDESAQDPPGAPGTVPADHEQPNGDFEVGQTDEEAEAAGSGAVDPGHQPDVLSADGPAAPPPPDPDVDRPPLREINRWASKHVADWSGKLRSADAACRHLADVFGVAPTDVWELVTTDTPPPPMPQEAQP